MISFWSHFPQYHSHTPERLATMGPKDRERAERHLAKMKEEVDRYYARLEEIEAKHAAGICYCDDEYLCPKHADERWEEYKRNMKGDTAIPLSGEALAEHDKRIAAYFDKIQMTTSWSISR